MAHLWFPVWTAPVGGHRVSLTQGDSEVREGCGQRLEMKEGGPWGGCWLGEQPLWRGMNRVPSMTVGFQWERGLSSVQFSSVAQSCPTLCDPMNCTTPDLPVHHQLPEFTQTHVHRVGDGGWEDPKGAWPSPTRGDLHGWRGPCCGQSWASGGGTPEALAGGQFFVWRRAAGGDISTDTCLTLCEVD